MSVPPRATQRLRLGARCAGATALLIGEKNVSCCDRFRPQSRRRAGEL